MMAYQQGILHFNDCASSMQFQQQQQHINRQSEELQTSEMKDINDLRKQMS